MQYTKYVIWSKINTIQRGYQVYITFPFVKQHLLHVFKTKFKGMNCCHLKTQKILFILTEKLQLVSTV